MTGVDHSPDVVVRLIYLKDGKPAQNQQIILYEGDPSKAGTIRLNGTTSIDGTAKFHLSEPLPKTVWLYEENGRITGCASEDAILLSDVIEHGATIGVDSRFGGSCKGDQGQISRLGAKPGEIVMFVRKLNALDNLRHY